MVSSSVRTIRQYCSVCKATLEMAIVDTVQDDEVTWLKCPRCNGILPHMMSAEDETPAAQEPQAPVAEEAPGALSEESKAQAVDYEEDHKYEVDQVVYHRSMNAFGRVTKKSVLPGNRHAIVVQFEDGTEMTLREGA